MFKKKEPIPLTGLQEFNDKSLFKVENVPSEPYSVMVIDIGTIFIKYSLYISYNGTDRYLARAEIKYMNEIYGEGKINFNLLRRDINRKVEAFSELGKIDLLVIIPQKATGGGILLPRMEFREKYKDYKEAIKNEYKILEQKDHVYDWIKTCDNEVEDYHSIFIDYIPQDLVFEFNLIAVNQKVTEFYITSPMVSFLGLFDDDKAHLVIDFGHTSSTLTIVKGGTIYATRTFSKGGHAISESIGDETIPQIQKMEEKHNAILGELPLAVGELIDELKNNILDFLSIYHKQFDDAVQDYCIIGGSASLEFEEDLNTLTIGINRIYPKMDLVNDKVIPSETRNYLFPSYGTYMYLLHNKYDKERVIDFSASKSGGTGLKIKQLVSKYHKYKAPLIAGLIGLYALTGVTAYTSKTMGEYNTEVSTELQTYTQQAQGVQQSLETLNKEYNALLTENAGDDFKDTGVLLHRLKEITPPRFNIKSIELEGRGDNGTIIVKSDSQVVVSSFLTLLQDPTNGIFNKADIIDIQLVESLGEQYYQTTILVEGRKI